MPRTKIYGFADLKMNFKAGRRLSRSHMGLSSKVDASALRETEPVDIARVCGTSTSSSGWMVKGFSCIKGRQFNIDLNQHVDMLQK
jgi:hypothetical protein